MGNVRRRKQLREAENEARSETREIIEIGTENPVEVGVPEAEQGEEKGGNNEIEGEISEDEILPVQRTTRRGRIIKNQISSKLEENRWRRHTQQKD
jgi:hypothetical protein